MFERGENMILKKIPKYAIIPTIILIFMQFLTYYGTQFINSHLEAHDFTIEVIDGIVPVVSFFIIFYVLSYPWWYISPLVVANTNEKRFYNWAFALIVSFFLCGIIFIALPTTIVRPTIEGDGLFNRLTNFIYSQDSPERPINLFPSYHVLFSWFCYIGVRRQKNIHLWYRISAFVFAVLISLSTQFVKQHYIVDLVSAIILSEVIFYIVTKYNLGNLLKKMVTRT